MAAFRIHPLASGDFRRAGSFIVLAMRYRLCGKTMRKSESFVTNGFGLARCRPALGFGADRGGDGYFDFRGATADVLAKIRSSFKNCSIFTVM